MSDTWKVRCGRQASPRSSRRVGRTARRFPPAHLSEIHVERLEHQTEMISMHEVGEQMDDVFFVVRIVGGQQFEIFELLLAGFVHGLIAADQLDDQFAALCARRAVGARQQLAHAKHRAEHTRALQTAHAVATALQQIAKTVAVVALRTETEQQTTRRDRNGR